MDNFSFKSIFASFGGLYGIRVFERLSLKDQLCKRLVSKIIQYGAVAGLLGFTIDQSIKCIQ